MESTELVSATESIPLQERPVNGMEAMRGGGRDSPGAERGEARTARA